MESRSDNVLPTKRITEMGSKIGLIGPDGRLGKIIQSMETVFPIFKQTPRTSLPCDVLIDVSTPDALLENLSANLPIVVGTTGHVDFYSIENASKKIPVFYSPNFSIGAFLLKRMAKMLSENFFSDIDIIETHDKRKKDIPSGTAIDLKKIVPSANIHSLRSGQAFGEHTLIFNSEEERLILTHQAHSRAAYAKGALLAAQYIMKKPPGLYTMDNLFP